jgi:hypothetical protein
VFHTQLSRSGGPLVEIEQPAEPGTASHATRSLYRRRARDEAIVEPLVIPFPMIVFDEFCQGMSKVLLPTGIIRLRHSSWRD